VLKTGSRWQDLPREYRSKALYHRLLRGRAVAYIQANSERLMVRWEHRAYIYLAFLLLACSLILLKAISG